MPHGGGGGCGRRPRSSTPCRLAPVSRIRFGPAPGGGGGLRTPPPLVDHVPVAADFAYRFGPDTVEIAAGHFATERTQVAFDGTSAWGGESAIRFHVTSRDWQESDRVLAGVLTDFGARTGPVAVGGSGEFDGRLTGPVRRPRVGGPFTGENLRAWDTIWGDGSAQIVVENNYVAVSDGSVRRDAGEIRAEGLFSLGCPRSDGGDEI